MPYKDRAARLAYARKHWKENKEQRGVQAREYYQKHRDAILAQKVEYRKEHKREIREYYQKNKEKIAVGVRVYQEEHRDIRRKREQERRTRKASLLATLTVPEWEYILDFWFHQCAYCGAGGDLTQDHIVPLSKGGGYTKANILPACSPCNFSKGSKDLIDWLPNPRI